MDGIETLFSTLSYDKGKIKILIYDIDDQVCICNQGHPDLCIWTQVFNHLKSAL